MTSTVKALARGAVSSAAIAVLLVASAARGAEPDVLKALAKDEARIAKDVPPDRNVDAATAFRMTTTDKVPIVDVRTVQEYQFVGHVPGAFSIPAFLWGRWDDQKRSFGLDPNPDFVKQFAAVFPDKSAPVIVMCRSGHRSAKATKLLVGAGYSRVYQLWEGFEGVAVPDKDLPSYGKKLVDGWRNRGLPYTWDMDPALVVLR